MKRNKLILVILIAVVLVTMGYLILDYYLDNAFDIHTELKRTVHKLLTIDS
jgi:hypothetical protein